MNKFDIVIIGAGISGYNSAIIASKNNFSVACIDNWKNNGEFSLGGTYNNDGCIPSKVLFNSVRHYDDIINNSKNYGISTKNIKIDLNKILEYKNKIIKKNSDIIYNLFKNNNISFFNGFGYINNNQYKDGYYKISILNENNINNINIYGKYIILSTGSKPKKYSNLNFDKSFILSSSDSLSLNKLYKDICIIGAGDIGLELAYFWSTLGVNIEIFEINDIFLEKINYQLGIEILKIFSKKFKINLKTTINDIYIKNNKVNIDYNNMYNERKIKKCDKLIISIGREPNIDLIKSFKLPILLKNNAILVNDKYQTNLKNIFAIGDVIGYPMISNKAEIEAKLVIENILGYKKKVNYDNIPRIIYTYPEIASVGISDINLYHNRIPYFSKIFPYYFNMKSRILNKQIGFIKISINKINGEILNSVIVGSDASELISIITLALKFKATIYNIEKIIFPYPTLSEIFKEISLFLNNSSIYNY